MKILIVSDLHTDVNQTNRFGFVDEIDKNDLTLIAGDISGDWQNERAFLDELTSNKPICCVGGNHLGYNYLYRYDRLVEPLNGTKQDSLDRLSKFFSDGNIQYLDNRWVEIGDYVVFGGCMYTDFKLYGDPKVYGEYGEQGLNDFRLVHTMDYENDIIRPLYYTDYIKWHDKFVKELTKCIEETTKDIIVLTHFAPSLQSISEKYNGRYKNLNPCYASDMEQLITDNPRIKLWVHGHMHDSFDYTVGGCRVICEPYGYYGREQSVYPENFLGKVVKLD